MERGTKMEEKTSAECVKRTKKKGFESMLELVSEYGVDVNTL